jgi:hypothetical protein
LESYNTPDPKNYAGIQKQVQQIDSQSTDWATQIQNWIAFSTEFKNNNSIISVAKSRKRKNAEELPESVLEEIKELLSAMNELARHYWSRKDQRIVDKMDELVTKARILEESVYEKDMAHEVRNH